MSIVETLKARASVLVFVSVALGVATYEWHQAKSATLPAAESKPKAANARGVLAEGRLVPYPDAEVTLGAETGGKLLKLLVHERDHVEPGQIIAEIDVTEQRAALSEAWARVKESEPDISFLEQERIRSEHLLAQNVLARAAYDKSAHDAESATRHRASLLATSARLKAQIDKATVRAPIAGAVTARFVEAGAYVSPGTPIVTLVDLTRQRVQAEIGEFDTARVALGAKVTLRAEGYSASFHGTVEEIPDEVVARQMKPLDPSRPVDTRVLLVKIRLDEPVPLRLGQRVEVEIR
ncbi:MAG TPA: efflux RND transporter periplasmic adaptor subunit [Polyangiaceae bacterium]|nr:efflux RND transporter periplasmic adaptor subunit [Polyangiaceae bacterium]